MRSFFRSNAEDDIVGTSDGSIPLLCSGNVKPSTSTRGIGESQAAHGAAANHHAEETQDHNVKKFAERPTDSLTTEETLAIVGFSKSYLLKIERLGVFPKRIGMFGKNVLYSKWEVDQWHRANKVPLNRQMKNKRLYRV